MGVVFKAVGELFNGLAGKRHVVYRTQNVRDGKRLSRMNDGVQLLLGQVCEARTGTIG